MEKPRTLPPLVRGRVTAVLDFFVDKISIKNISVSMDTFDLVLQVQWWGEDLPTCIRPEKACYRQGRLNRNSDSMEMHFQCVRYEIKTTLELFKLYLKTCEVLELCVLDVVTKCIIGSAFLKDLVNLLNRSTNFITAPVFDYLGEEIGEVVICFHFLDKFQDNDMRKNEEAICMYENNYSRNLDKQDFKMSDGDKKTWHPSSDNNVFNRLKKSTYRDLSTDCDSSVIKYRCGKNDKSDYNKLGQENTTNAVSSTREKINENYVRVSESLSNSCKCLPEIATSCDSSKILYFGLNPQKSKQKMCINSNPKAGTRNKFNSDSIKCKSKSTSTENLSTHENGPKVEESSKSKPLSPVVSKHSQEKAVKVMDSKHSVDKTSFSSHNQTPIKEKPSKESIESKVLDFLLGSDLCKEDEESAINEFKKMSPSRNLVISLNQLCVTSDSSDSNKSENRYMSNPLESSRQPNLTFDLANPIERNYYEKFFLKPKLFADLELAEFLNQPENKAVLDRVKSEDGRSTKLSSECGDSKSSKPSPGEKNNQQPKREEHFAQNYNQVNFDAKGCARCKYYKKLDELDKIIESLKRFERKMLVHEKDMESALSENPKMYVRGNQLSNT